MAEKDLKKAVVKALAEVMPFLESHGGGLEVVSVKKGKAVLKIKGACLGCPLSQVTYGEEMKKMIKKKVAEIKTVEFI